jgi:pantoate--beta-alanine ligase
VQTIIARSLLNLKKNLNNLKKNQKIGLVPTMGCIHDGHLELIKKCKKLKYFTVVSIFVNPAQFNDQNDFSKYPTQEKKDLEILTKYDVDLVFFPKVKQIYPLGYSTYVKEKNFSNILCGKYRKNHFSGVLTVVLKLFLIIQPYAGFFGEKDFQQLFLIKKMVKDLNLGVKIISIPTVRDSGGLALSSRNKFLNSRGLEIAKQIYLNVKKIKYLDYKHTKDLELYLKKQLKKSGLTNIEYIEIRDSKSLKHPKNIIRKRALRVFIAIYIGNVRLIDNYKLN